MARTWLREKTDKPVPDLLCIVPRVQTILKLGSSQTWALT